LGYRLSNKTGKLLLSFPVSTVPFMTTSTLCLIILRVLYYSVWHFVKVQDLVALSIELPKETSFTHRTTQKNRTYKGRQRH